MDLEFEIYKGKKYSSLLKDIVTNSEDRGDTLSQLIDDLRMLVKTPNDAIIIIPMIKECLDVTVKNDEQLIKLAAVIQRLVSANSRADDGTSYGLSEEEKKQLFEEANKIVDEMKGISIPISKESAEQAIRVAKVP